MIKFFRTIRQNLLNQGKTSKYLKYAIGEIILVVIGILIALNINNWNEEQKERLLEKEAFNSLLISLSSDLENQINFNIRILKFNIESINYIKQLLNGDIIYNDSIDVHFGALMTSKGFSPEVTAYKELENRGMHIIKNSELKNRILKIYNDNYPEVQRRIENFQNNLMAFFRPVMYENFSFNLNSQGNNVYTPLNIEELLKNQLYKNVVETAHLNFINNHSYFLEIQEEVISVIDFINTELKN
jgi:hypothetical protein